MELDDIQLILQKSLTLGWREFLESDSFVELEKFSEFLRNVKFFDSEYHGSIPHPAHEFSARLMGKYFNISSRELDLHYSDYFPGDYRKSNEIFVNNYKVRRFYLDVYKRNLLISNAILSFPHQHDVFDFPATPTIELLKVKK